MTHFQVNQEVVCIDDSQPPLSQPLRVKKGEIYVVRWIGPFYHYMLGEYIGVRLKGIDQGICPDWGYEDVPFQAKRFRPLVEDRIGMLRALLVPNQPVTPTIDEPRRKAPVREEERV
ncbi:hypothetical protein E2A64_10430 [Pseudohoeflea suaedae]|uniref:CAP-Gly domain protein n=1 Tax=Pseudohoeflea suaedae TaxID=877384 RepID=A0A4V3A703_9HYPH|nr:hypothetical protein [Pseudohoeflea suaedae]TDH35742.1 hypothetical protein E2A64_10430 [Pseudohoeflea suaedae]